MRQLVFLLILACVLAGCVIIPLPDKGPALRHVGLPQIGETEQSVRERFGQPQLLDSGDFLVYEWTHDRKFVLVAAIPSGLPVGGVVARGRIRLLVALNEQRKVLRVQCSVVDGAAEGLAKTDCFNRPANLIVKPNDEPVKGLPNKLWLSSTLSPDARLLAVTDSDRGTWVADVERSEVIGKHDGVRSFRAGLPRVAFDRSGNRLAIAQLNVPTVIVERTGPTLGLPRPLSQTTFATAAFPCCIDGLAGIIGMADKQASWIDLDQNFKHESGVEGRIAFSRVGAEVKRTASYRLLVLAALDSRSIERSPRAVFGSVGFPSAILDNRPAEMANGSASYAFSQDGRLLARSTCNRVELWQSEALADALTTVGRLAAGPVQVFLKPLQDASTVSLPMPYDCPGGAITFHPSGERLAVADTNEIHIWRISDGQHLARFATGERSPIVALAFAPEGYLTAIAMSSRGPPVVLRWESDAP